jgi:hypothetical protein
LLPDDCDFHDVYAAFLGGAENAPALFNFEICSSP